MLDKPYLLAAALLSPPVPPYLPLPVDPYLLLLPLLLSYLPTPPYLSTPLLPWASPPPMPKELLLRASRLLPELVAAEP